MVKQKRGIICPTTRHDVAMCMIYQHDAINVTRPAASILGVVIGGRVVLSKDIDDYELDIIQGGICESGRWWGMLSSGGKWAERMSFKRDVKLGVLHCLDGDDIFVKGDVL